MSLLTLSLSGALIFAGALGTSAPGEGVALTRLALGVVAVLLLPGFVLLQCRRGEAFRPPEALSLSFGLSLLLMVPLTLAAFAFHLPADAVVLALVLWNIAESLRLPVATRRSCASQMRFLPAPSFLLVAIGLLRGGIVVRARLSQGGPMVALGFGLCGALLWPGELEGFSARIGVLNALFFLAAALVGWRLWRRRPLRSHFILLQGRYYGAAACLSEQAPARFFVSFDNSSRREALLGLRRDGR